MTTEQELLQRAATEIQSLRRQNEIINARLSTFDSIMQVLHAQLPSQNMGMSEDLVWEINKHLESESLTK